MSIPVALFLILLAVGWSVQLVTMIRNDGHARSPSFWADQHRPPRSHVPDAFDPALRH